MPQWLEKIHAFHRPKSTPPLPHRSQPGRAVDETLAIPTAPAKQHDAAGSHCPSQHADLWKSAYDQLDAKVRAILSDVQTTYQREDDGQDRFQTVAAIDGVIQITEEKYKQYQQGAIKIRSSKGKVIDLRELSRKILNAALYFRDVVNTVVAFDPTRHAASAWAVISLGLSVRIPIQRLLGEE